MSEAKPTASRPTTVFLARWRGGINFLCDAIRELGWRQGGMRECAQCDLYMAGPQLGLTLDRDDDFRNLREDQRCSRFPRMDWVTLKAPTTRLLHLLSQFYDDCSNSTVPVVTGAAAGGDCDPAVSAGAEYAASQRSTPNPAWFYPQTFILPEQMRELKASLENSVQQRQRQCCFIIKPSKGSQGKGIELCFGSSAVHNAAQQMSMKCPCVAQRYLSSPHTLCGMKWDARIYCVLSSVGPLKAWLYMDGLARFCTVPYESPCPENVGSEFMHLTNYSLNCESKTFDPVSSKRCLSSVLEELETNGEMRAEAFWSQASNLVAAAMVAYHPVLLAKYRGVFSNPRERCRCFHILGLDILITNDMKMHLLEVNCNPSLNLMKAGSQVIKSAVDVKVKTGLLQGALKLVNRERLGESVSEADAADLQYRRVACNSNSSVTENGGDCSCGPQKSSHDNGIRGAKALEAAALYFAKHRNRHSRRQDGEHTISRELLQARLRVHAATAEPRCRQEVSRIFRNIPESLSVEAFLDLMVHLGCIFNDGNDLEAQVLQLLMVLEP